MRTIAVNSLLIVGGLIAGVLLSEAALRFAGIFPKDIHVVDQRTGLFTLPKNSHTPYAHDCIDNTVATNDAGFHAFSYDEKRDGEFRIAIVGDSFVEALQVPREKHFAALLERSLNALPSVHPHYTVRPFGVSGNGTYANLLYANAYTTEYEPDLIIDMFFLGNDLDDDLAGAYAPSWDTDGKIVLAVPKREEDLRAALMKHSVIWRGMRVLSYAKARAQFDRTHSVATATPNERAFYSPANASLWEDAWEEEGQLFRDFHNFAQERNAHFAVAVIPETFTIHTEFVSRVFPDGVDDVLLQKPEEDALRVLRDDHIPAFSFGPEFRDTASSTGEMSVWPCDWHWNEYGHAWAADALFHFLSGKRELLSQ